MGTEMFSTLTLAYFLMCISISRSMQFPNLRNPIKLNARLQNLATNSYLSVTKNDKGELKLNFKLPVTDQDPEVAFTIYYYTDADIAENKILFLVHEATSSFMNTTSENNIQMIPMKITTEGIMEDPMKFTKADSRFLHISMAGSYYTLNFLIDDGNAISYLAADSSNVPIVKKIAISPSYPEEVLFSIKELDE